MNDKTKDDDNEPLKDGDPLIQVYDRGDTFDVAFRIPEDGKQATHQLVEAMAMAVARFAAQMPERAAINLAPGSDSHH